jgi:protein-tyrosine phosphatase
MQMDDVRRHAPNDPAQPRRLGGGCRAWCTSGLPGTVFGADRLDLFGERPTRRARDDDVPPTLHLVGDEVEHAPRDAFLRRLRRVQDHERGVAPRLLYRWSVIDLHSHILPGVDDGARTLEEAREIARQSVADGVTTIAATPHVRADFPTTADEMEAGVDELRYDFAVQGIDVEVVYGGEIDFGVLFAIPAEDLLRFTYAQAGHYLLVECPYRGSPLPFESSILALRRRGITAILAHPERNPTVQDRPDHLVTLVEAGALVQVTAGSLAGSIDRASQYCAQRLLDLGLVHVLASDAHGHMRDAGLSSAARDVRDPGLARYLTYEAPAAVLAGEAVPEAPKRSLDAASL